ncbi:penicillin-binding protein 2 [Microbacterium sp. M28]|nr:penicillin-binding protein 2 [Microbacterium sp. M28]
MTTRATRGPRRRTVVALAVVFAVLAAFVVRLVDIQVVSADDHVTDSLQVGNLGTTTTVAGNRGSIVDSNGTVLAASTLVYDVQLSPSLIAVVDANTKNPPAYLWAEASDKIAAIIGTTGEQLRADVAARLEEDPASQYLFLESGVNTEQYLKLKELKEEGLAYLAMKSRSVRVYPNGAVAGTMVGFLNGDGEGQYGVERMAGECLAPTDGSQTYRTGKDGVIIPGSQTTTDAVDGGTVQLTLNSDLNWYLQQMIAEEAQRQGAESATVTVVEVKSGKIRAAAEWPSVDPNNVDGTPQDYWKSQIFSKWFEPGSTFKAVTAATIIDQGAADWSTTVTAKSREHFPNGAEINDPFSHPQYTYTLAGALIDSSNVALSKYGTMVSPEVRHDYLAKFGVGQKTAIDFYGELAGQLHPASEWDNQSLYTTTFGQHFTITAAQLASTYQTLANDGQRIDLSLIESCTGADGTVVAADEPAREQVISESTAAQVQRMLENVAVQGGLSERIEVPGYRIATKTGTAQTPDGHGGYKSGVFDVSIVGYAPAEDPEYVVVVTMDEPTKIRNSAATAVAFQKAMTQVLKTYRVQPSTEPMDELLSKFD